jgi:serine/threonine protein kinase
MTRLTVRYIYSLHRINKLKRKLGHWSLVKDGGILHRDVSINNIMITITDNTDKQCEDKPKGFLIDLDLAKVIGSDSSGSVHRTGTMEFMAIEMLQVETNVPHSYRHDLESFFYVLIWICVKYELREGGHNKKCPPRVLDGWSGADAPSVKTAQMLIESEFRKILDAFSDEFRELESMMREIKEALFQLEGGKLIEQDQDQLYNAFLGAIQRQLDKMPK